MKNLITKFLLVSLPFLLSTTLSYAAVITAVKGKKVMMDKAQNLESGESYNVLDSNNRVKGKVKVLKKKGRKAMGQILSGKVQKNNRIAEGDSFSDFSEDFKEGEDSTTTQQKAVRGYLGLVMGSDLNSNPLLFGGDYLHPFHAPITLKAGVLYWTYSENGGNFSLLDLSGGASYTYSLTPQLDIEGGARLGMSMYTVSVTFFGQKTESSKSYLTLSPFASVVYKLNNKMKVGGEWRYPFFLSDVDFNGFYLMGIFEYQL